MHMHSNRKLRAKGTGVLRTGRSVPAAVCHPAISHLSVPRLSPDVPGTICLNSEGSQDWARHALNWLELGYLSDKDRGAAFELVQLAISRWVNGICGNMKHLTFDLHATLEHPYWSPEEEESNGESGSLKLLVGSEEIKIFSIGAKLAKLHELHPDLAVTALNWLGWVGARTLNIWTPWRAEYSATHIWWFGNDDQEGFLQEYASYHEEREDTDEEGEDGEMDEPFGPNQWRESFPDWVTKPEARMDIASLRSFSQSSPDPLLSSLAALVADIAENGDVEFGRVEEFEQESVYTSAILRWDEDDPMMRLYDDHIEQANYSSDYYTEIYGFESLPVALEDFSQKIAQLERVLRNISQLDRLIDLVADTD